ncbi:restriction endonuclease, partial [Campylobacter concisus]
MTDVSGEVCLFRAIAFYEGDIKHIYFVAETKGSMNSMQLRQVEESKIHCAKEH